MEVKVICEDIIKPSSTTPDNLRLHKLSFLDQIALKMYNPFVFYYSLNHESYQSIAEISKKLRESLSRALTIYYPLAGRRIDGQDLFECNDEGAPFIEARANTNLSDFLKNPIPLEINKLLPFEICQLATIPVGVKLNVFDCGGIALGVCVSHHLGDGLSSLMFIQTWMAIARGQDDAVVYPKFGSVDLFPPRDLKGYDLPVVITKDMCSKYITKRFVFESSKLETLRAKYQDENRKAVLAKRLSRIEVLTAFLWIRVANAIKVAQPDLTAKEYLILHAVNIRPKCNPPLSNNYYGNYYGTSLTNGLIASTAEEGHGCDLARKIGEDIRKVDNGSVEFMRANGDELLDILKGETARFEKGHVVRMFISSVCRFPLYESDFGLGKPTWVSSAARGFEDSVSFFDNKEGDGIEVYLCFKPEDMAKLEADEEFLSFVSPI